MDGVVVSQAAAGGSPTAWLKAAMERLPDGVAMFYADSKISYANAAARRLLGARSAELAGRNLWIALPELAGSVFHSQLLHARTVGSPVTWRGYYAPAGRWLSATAELVDDLLHVFFRDEGAALPEGPIDAADVEPVAAVDEDADRDRLRFLAEVSEGMITTLDRGESATQLAELVVPRLADWAIVALVDEDGAPGQEAWAHRDAIGRADLNTYLHGRLRGAGDDIALINALLSGEPVQVPDIDQERVAPSLPTEEVRAACGRLHASSCTIVRLRARGDTFGALALMNSGDRSLHSEMEIGTAVEVARCGALALDNARLYGRQLKVAETLQRSLLTPPPQPDLLEIAVRYRPASSHALVGGDFYDAFTYPDGATLLVIGDVVGHSIAAAAAMSQLRWAVRPLA